MEYIIGAGAILESGDRAGITPATLHAHVGQALASQVGAAAIDFDGVSPDRLRRLVLVATGWNAPRFRAAVSEPLRAKGDCTLADVLSRLGQATGERRVHLFANWLPDAETCSALAAGGIELIAHPLEAIEEAALVAGQRCRRWNAA